MNQNKISAAQVMGAFALELELDFKGESVFFLLTKMPQKFAHAYNVNMRAQQEIVARCSLPEGDERHWNPIDYYDRMTELEAATPKIIFDALKTKVVGDLPKGMKLDWFESLDGDVYALIHNALTTGEVPQELSHKRVTDEINANKSAMLQMLNRIESLEGKVAN